MDDGKFLDAIIEKVKHGQPVESKELLKILNIAKDRIQELNKGIDQALKEAQDMLKMLQGA